MVINDSELKIETYNDLCTFTHEMQIIHLPTGLKVEGKDESLHKLRSKLLSDLSEKLDNYGKSKEIRR